MIRPALAAALMGLAACGVGQDPALDTGDSTPSMESMGGATSDSITLTVTLTPESVVPGPGAEGAEGAARVTLHRGRGEACIELEADGISPVTGAHLHSGVEGKVGDVIVSLQVPTGATPTTGGEPRCVAAAANVLARVRLNPSRFYLDVHTDDRPNGALRGQLG